MDKISFGVPARAVMQVAYVVEDIEREMDRWSRELGVGPFFYIRHFPLSEVKYRGEPSTLDVDVALAFSGSMCFELVRQNDKARSVFRDVLDARGPGFHHWAFWTHHFDSDLRRHESSGRRVAATGVAGVGARTAFVDTFATLGGMIELIEITPKVEEFFAMVRGAAASWDGRDPVRMLGPA
jgi:hypothetical protein